MALADTEVDQTDPGTPLPTRRFRLRYFAIAGWAVALALYWTFAGVVTDPVMAVGWLWLATIAWNIERPWRYHLAFARDWAPIAVVLVLYEFSRGAADNGVAPHVMEMVHADRFLFGGELPTLWLQERLYDPQHVPWWEVLTAFIYLSHFVASLAVAAVLWLRNRGWWAAFMRRWLGLIAAGLTTYFLYPAAPPWWAAEHGYIDEVARISSRGWTAVGLDFAGKLITDGQAVVNPVAAMPSLHSGFALCVVAFFFTRVRKRWLPLLIAYPVSMSLVLAYTGEHYMVDAFVGWAYVGAVYLLVGVGERWWRRRRERAVADEVEAALAVAEPESLTR